MSEFFRTPMGHRFYESTMPSLVRELARLNESLDRVAELLERSAAAERAPAPAPAKPEASR